MNGKQGETNRPADRAFTIVEVLVSAVLIAISLGSILAINMNSLHTLRASREAAASSQVLQQRMEMIRTRPWADLSSSIGLAGLMSQPTVSEAELSDANMAETITVSVPDDASGKPSVSSNFFRLRRSGGAVTVETAGDFSQELSFFVDDSLTYRDHSGVHLRELRTIVCSAGLTRSGIVGSQLGRPQE